MPGSGQGEDIHVYSARSATPPENITTWMALFIQLKHNKHSLPHTNIHTNKQTIIHTNKTIQCQPTPLHSLHCYSSQYTKTFLVSKHIFLMNFIYTHTQLVQLHLHSLIYSVDNELLPITLTLEVRQTARATDSQSDRQPG